MSHAAAVAVLMSAFPDLSVVEVIHHEQGVRMTDTAPEQTEDYDAPERDGEAYPEYPGNPHNHRFTISFDPHKQPFVVVRTNTAEELKAAFAELETSGAYAAMGAAYDALKRQGAIGAGASAPAPQGPPAGPPPGTGPQYNPSMPPPQPAGSAPAAWQNAGAPPAPPIPAPPQGQWSGQAGGQANSRGPKPRPMDWPQVYKIDVPFNAKDAFKAHREQYKDYFKGKISWAGGGGYWVHGDVVQAMAAYNPVPA